MPEANRTEMDVIDRGAWDLGGDPRLKADPFGEWDRLREESRVFTSSMAPAWQVWALTRFDDVYSALRQPELFSSRSITPYGGPRFFDDPPVEGEMRLVPEELDPPEHTKYRQLLMPFFTPQRAAAMEGGIREWCAELIDGLQPQGSCDLNVDFARQFPTMIFLRMMGLPEGGVGNLLADVNQRMIDLAAMADGMGDMAVSGGYMMVVSEYMEKVLAERRETRADDITSYLLDVQIDGRPLTDDELRRISFLLYAAGLDTVANALGFTFLHLARNPDHRQRILEEPALIPNFVEEILRYYGVVSSGRIVTRDVEFAGCPMKTGDRILCSMPAANRDPREFPDAGEFQIDRPANRHIGFGAGPHRCLGSHLARVELRVAVEEWHARIPDYRISDEAAVSYKLGLQGVERLPLAWS
jgi:cytochrome P450